MELRHLRYFIAVAEELNFRRAAERLHLAQPALGRQIRDLEEEIGERLFERDRRHVALTEAGRVLLGEARGLLAGAAAAIESARDAGRGTRGTLRLGNIGTLCASFLPRSLAAFREQFPRVDIEILELQNDEQRASLLDGAIQLGFQVRVPGLPVESCFSARPVLECGVSVALPSRHPLAANRAVSLRSLGSEKLLDLRQSQGAAYGRWVRAVCEQEGEFSPRFRKPPVETAHALLGLVAAGDGLAFFPMTMIDGFPPCKDWVARPLCPRRIRFVLDAVWNPANPSRILSSYLSLLPGQALNGRLSQKTSRPFEISTKKKRQ